MFISNLMSTNFVCCTKDHSLREVLKMFTQTNSNIIPVVDDSKKLIGIITKNKLFLQLAINAEKGISIGQLYAPNPIYLRPSETVEEARVTLLKHNIAHAPVVNGEMIPIGVMSTKQLLSSYNIVYSQLSSVLDIAYDAIIIVNNKAQITKVNRGFTELTGFKSSEVIGKFVNELFPELDMENVIKTGIKTINTPQIVNNQQTLISIFPIKENGKTISAICKITYRGLTHLHEALTKVKMLEKQLSAYRNEINEMKGTKYTLFDIAGESKVIKKVKHEASLAAKSMSTVLITGESGTGKELFAQGIHAFSGQKGPFIQVNSGAIPPELLESEFFGYADGAFTGAKKGGMKGKFELAQNGTIFLDEIGDMPFSLQVKLLRVLQEKEFQPIGSSKTIHLNTKIIAATNKDIEKLVEEGKFREDLYYRLNIMRLNIPPLRERIEDLPEIIQVIISRLNQSGFQIKGVTHSALTQLMRHSWPGNVRELHNVLERAANIKSGDYIDSEDIPDFTPHQTDMKIGSKQEDANNYKEKLQDKEKDLILAALKEAKGNKTKASQLLGISRPWLYHKIKKYQIE